MKFFTGDGTECVTIEPLHDCARCDIKAKCFNETCICDKVSFIFLVNEICKFCLVILENVFHIDISSLTWLSCQSY